MKVQKTVLHQGKTLTHGDFDARATVHVCAARCRHANGALVTRPAQALQTSLLPGRSVGYDVMVFVGIERYLHHRQREEIQDLLLGEHGISLSTGTISDLARVAAVCRSTCGVTFLLRSEGQATLALAAYLASRRATASRVSARPVRVGNSGSVA